VIMTPSIEQAMCLTSSGDQGELVPYSSFGLGNYPRICPNRLNLVRFEPYPTNFKQ
jgi:hypothetical protein